jgi:hypothetical protein
MLVWPAVDLAEHDAHRCVLAPDLPHFDQQKQLVVGPENTGPALGPEDAIIVSKHCCDRVQAEGN